MWLELFLCLLLAHLIADFMLQTSKSCNHKRDNKWRSPYQFIHAGEVFVLSWLVTFDLRFWWGAAIIGILHYCIDTWKSYRSTKVTWFSLDQIFHLLVIAGVVWLWCEN